MATGILEKLKVPARQATKLKREAERMGVSTERYLKDVIKEHLQRVERIQNSTFAELAAPFREAFKGMSEEQLDALVDAARSRRRARKARRTT